MAIKTYKVGKVMVEGTQIHELQTATLTVTLGSEDTQEIGESWADPVGTGRAWTLSLACKHDPADTVQAALRTEMLTGDGLLSAIQMWVDGSSYFSGSGALLTNLPINKSVGPIDTVTFELAGKGALSWTA